MLVRTCAVSDTARVRTCTPSTDVHTARGARICPPRARSLLGGNLMPVQSMGVQQYISSTATGDPSSTPSAAVIPAGRGGTHNETTNAIHGLGCSSCSAQCHDPASLLGPKLRVHYVFCRLSTVLHPNTEQLTSAFLIPVGVPPVKHNNVLY